jgi:polyisoprenoid-binding protein YceI
VQFQRLIFIFVLGLLSACGVPQSTTPQPTLDPTAAITPRPEMPRFEIDDEKSAMNYVASGAGLFGFAQLPGLFRLKGRAAVFVPEGSAYRLKVDLVIDGTSATALNALFLSELRDILEIDKYPYAYFEGDSKELVTLDPGPTPFTVSGILDLHGHKVPLALPLSMTIHEGVILARGEVVIDLADYGCNVPTAVMSSRITFKIEITARKAAGTS